MEPLHGVDYREAEADDWPAIGALIGRTPDEAAQLRRQLQQGYDPWFAHVATTVATTVPVAPGAGAPQRLAGVVVAGVPRGAGAAVAGEPGEQREVRVLWLEVAPSLRRQGIGTRLLELALDDARAHGVRRAALLVDATQFEALALFRKLGFQIESETLALVLGPEPARAVAGAQPEPEAGATLRPLTLDDVPQLAGLLIELGVERAARPHDDLTALTPSEVEYWLQQAPTVAYAAWEQRDPQTALGLAWASRRRNDAVLRFIGVHDDARRRGIWRALLGALVEGLARPPAAGGPGAGHAGRYRPLRAQLHDAGDEREFFRRIGFAAERITYEMARSL